ncbi:hypothetical protein BaRGS_00007416 [Batillaria attramentaria]|uniref:Uncharacterized protein n=1 Tax=Batillaria attramentaria TaxID=370345 RepID=A0ABD0LPW5_9CAEN
MSMNTRWVIAMGSCKRVQFALRTRPSSARPKTIDPTSSQMSMDVYPESSVPVNFALQIGLPCVQLKTLDPLRYSESSRWHDHAVSE